MYIKKYAKKLEKLIEQLQQENQQLKRNCNIGNENLNFYREEYKKLEDNCDELKGTLEYSVKYNSNGKEYFESVLYVMKDIEKRGVSDVED